MTEHTITVFGSSRVGPDDPRYARAEQAGRLLAQAGFGICSGGYDGLMAAVSRGARQAGGRTVGVTLKAFDPHPANEWIDEEIKAPTYIWRVEHMVDMGEGYLVLDGGMGTLAELSLTWSLLQIGALPRRPCVLLGEAWREMVGAFHKHLIIKEQDFSLLQMASTPEQAAEIFVSALRAGGQAA